MIDMIGEVIEVIDIGHIVEVLEKVKVEGTHIR